MWKVHCLVCTLLAISHLALAIVGAGRDLVLTPKQTLQANGKRIYYEEEHPTGVLRPWERTLKHVTYVTLFTDAAIDAAAGNLSQLHDYHDFLQTPYLPAAAQSQLGQSRFGDIVTLASGRLEQLSSNGSYRFVEGAADARASPPGIQTRALWRVQRIRHRDGIDQRSPQRYHYELKFSVSPLVASIGWPPQSYIQKESDYPQSFGRHVYEEKRAQRRQDRQDRQTQATFVRSIFQAAPPPLPPLPPPQPPSLNIGEYLKEGAPKGGASKIELFPGLFNVGLRPNYIPATTFRPSYPAKFGLRPELPPALEPYPLPNELNSPNPGAGPGAGHGPGAADAVANPPVTHHFHHHFYMTPGGGLIDAGNHADLAYRPSNYVPELTTLNPNTDPHHPQQAHHPHQPPQQLQFPANREPSSGESLETGEDEHQDQEQHPLVRAPHLYADFEPSSKYKTSKLPPLLIYAGAAAEAGEDQKSFVQSEPLEETIYRYSEPDPLYVHQHPVDVLHLEIPHNYQADEQSQQKQQQQQALVEHEPQVEEDTEEELELEQEQHQRGAEQRPAGSQKQPNVASTAPMPTTTAATTTTTRTTTTMTSTASSTSTMPPARATPTSRASFVSTSTSFTPLRALSRYRTTPRITAGRSTTTTTTTTSTEMPPIAKWKLRRKENATSSQDSRAKSSHRHESKVAFEPTTTTTTTMAPITTTTAAAAMNSSMLPMLPAGEVIEVLTQKSVSKSVSIKVGENGEEIPIIVDDDENEVKHS